MLRIAVYIVGIFFAVQQSECNLLSCTHYSQLAIAARHI